jgi:hypothetical protein
MKMKENSVTSHFTDLDSLSLPEVQPRLPQDLPRGILAPPARVLEIVAREKAKFSAEIFTPEAEERLVHDLTLQYYFENSGVEVLYRRTPGGPEVMAVGFEEILVCTRDMPLEERMKLNTWLP